MARSKGRSGGGGGRSSSSRRSAPAEAPAEVEIVEEEGGMGIDDGIVILTTLALLAALVFLDYARGQFYGEGMLFKGNYEAPADFDAGLASADDAE